MACRICGKNDCTESFHSFAEQEKFEAKQVLCDEIKEWEDEIKRLKKENDELRKEIRDRALIVLQEDGLYGY